MTIVAAQTPYNWLLFFHVFAAMIWVGGGVILAAIAGRVLRDPEPNAVTRFTGILRVVGPLVLAPASVAVLGLGIGLVLEPPSAQSGPPPATTPPKHAASSHDGPEGTA